MSRSSDSEDPNQSQRVDKWLWAARFFKTRGLAAEAVKGGKVDVNGQRAKPAKTVRVNDHLSIRRGAFLHEVTVRKLAPQRLSAAAAADLYLESEESRAHRETLALQIKAANHGQPRTRGRPSKRDRRALLKFTRGESD
jgi:ribosome-associated heat shock protein Hsp15